MYSLYIYNHGVLGHTNHLVLLGTDDINSYATGNVQNSSTKAFTNEKS